MNADEQKQLEERLKKAWPLIKQTGGLREAPIPPSLTVAIKKIYDEKFPPKPNSLIEFFQWLLSGPRLAPVCVACSLLVIVAVGLTITLRSSHGPVIQLAMLDVVGDTRGTNTDPVKVIQQALNQPKVETFSASAELKRWLETWPADDQKPVVKVIYDRDKGDVRVVGHIKGKPPFEKTFPVQREEDLPAVLKAAQAFIQEQIR